VHLLGTEHEDWWPCSCFAARARKQVCSFVFHWHHQLHHPGSEACCVWKNAAVKQLSVRSLPFKTKHFISAVKKNAAVPTSCALALKETPVNI